MGSPLDSSSERASPFVHETAAVPHQRQPFCIFQPLIVSRRKTALIPQIPISRAREMGAHLRVLARMAEGSAFRHSKGQS